MEGGGWIFRSVIQLIMWITIFFFFYKILKNFEVSCLSCLIQTRENTEEYYLGVQGIRNVEYDSNPDGINLNTVIFQ